MSRRPSLTSMEVVVPDGCFEGDRFVMTTPDGRELDVIVPDGCIAGDAITVDVPLPKEAAGGAVEVVIPDGCFEGAFFIVSTADGQELEVAVPPGCGPGDAILVDVPPPLPPAPKEPAKYSWQDGRDGGGSRNGAGSSNGSLTQRGETSSEFTKKKGKGINLNLSLGNGVSLNLALCTQGKYKVDSAVEVCRTDGTWTMATVKDYDWRGATYTVQLPDMRLKYFVEEEDLRHPGTGFHYR